MKNLKRLTFVIVLVALLLGMATVVNAQSGTPTVDTTTRPQPVAGAVPGQPAETVFANGTAITIKARTDGQAGAEITWEGAVEPILVNEYAIIFGGSHESAIDLEETNITMEGGKVKSIFGGGLHQNKVGTANVIINGGTVTGAVQGGGAAYLAGATCITASSHGTPAVTEAKDTKTVVETANVTVNGGNIGIVYGGGESMSYTKVANVAVNGGDIGTVAGTGSNGFMDESNITVTGGDIAQLQTLNRGTLGSASVTATGGKIDRMIVAGAEDSVNDARNVVPSKVDTITINLDGDVKVNTLEEGWAYPAKTEDNEKPVLISMKEGTVEKPSQFLREGSVEVKTVVITVGGQTFEVVKGTTIKALTEAKASVIAAIATFKDLNGEDQEYVLVDDEGNTYGDEDELVADVTLKVAVNEPSTDEPGTTEPGEDVPGADVPGTDVPGTDVPGTDEPATTEPDNGNGGTTANPNTGDNVVVYSVAGLVGLAVVAISLVRKNKLSK